MNLVMKFHDKEDIQRELEIEICENGRLSFIRSDEYYEYPSIFVLEPNEADKFFSEILKLREMVKVDDTK